MKWIQEIKEDDLKDTCLEICELIGFNNTLKLIKNFGGSELYIPKIETIAKAKRDVAICKEFNGYNYKTLARKYNLTERHVREICRDVVEKKKQEPIKNQISIFDLK